MNDNEALSRIQIQQDTKVPYLSTIDVIVGLRNASPWPLVLDDLTFVFHGAQPGVPEQLLRWQHRCRPDLRQPGDMFEELVQGISPRLVWAPFTNMYRVEAIYRLRKDGQWTAPITAVVSNNPHGSYLIINPASVMQGKTGEPASVFISFKDSEDWPLAKIARELLPRAGFDPYLAREDVRVGCGDYWEEKIYPAIERAEGVLAIWTPNCVAKPESVLREINQAQKVGTPNGLLLQRGTSLPSAYPGDKREYRAFDRDEAFVEFATAIEACARQWRTCGRFF